MNRLHDHRFQRMARAVVTALTFMSAMTDPYMAKNKVARPHLRLSNGSMKVFGTDATKHAMRAWAKKPTFTTAPLTVRMHSAAKRGNLFSRIGSREYAVPIMTDASSVWRRGKVAKAADGKPQATMSPPARQRAAKTFASCIESDPAASGRFGLLTRSISTSVI